MSDTLTGVVALLDGMAFEAISGSGHRFTLDATPPAGGEGRGPLPLELLLLGLGGCTAMDVIVILRKMRQEVTDYRVLVGGERAEGHPRVFTSLTVEHIVTGRWLDVALVRRAVELSTTRYCSAGAMLRRAAPIATRCRVVDTAAGAETVADLADDLPER
jgi:putative redox protein